VAESVLVGLSLTARTDANDSALVADVAAFRAAIITTLTDIVGVPPTAVSRLVLRLPDCTQMLLEPRLPLNMTTRRRRLADNDGTGAVPCTPTVDKMQVLLVMDTSSIGGNATVETALARVGAVFYNAPAYIAAFGSLYTAWDAIANVTTNATAGRSIDLVFSSDDASAVAATSGGSPSSSHLLGAGMALLALCIASAAVVAWYTCRQRLTTSSPEPDATSAADLVPPDGTATAPDTPAAAAPAVASPAHATVAELPPVDASV